MSDDKGSDRQRFEVGDRVRITVGWEQGFVGTVVSHDVYYTYYHVLIDGAPYVRRYCDFELGLNANKED